MKRILLTGGGTAGHVTPNIAIIPKLKKKYELYYIGSYKGIEKDLIPETGITYKAISTGKLRRYFSMQNFADFFRVIRGTVQAFFYIKKVKPKLVFSKGGFVAVPVVLAAKLCNVPVVCHESDLSPGIATRISAKFANKICCTFEECAKLFGSKGVHTGTPLRESLFNGSPEKARKKYNLDDKPVLVIIGGSQGAAAVNNAIQDILDPLTQKYNIIHLCGEGKVNKELLNVKSYIQIEYLKDELADVFALADMIISRAGSNSIEELHALEKPMLLIPLPRTSVSRGDQIQNAKNYEQKGLAHVLLQEDISKETLMDAIDKLYIERETLITNLKNNPAKQGRELVIEIIDQNVAK